MKYAEAQLLFAGYKRLILWVLDGNARATAFYESQGWVPTGKTRHDSLDRTLLTDAQMAKDVTSGAE